MTIGSEIQVTTNTANQYYPALAYSPKDNNFLFSWEDGRNIISGLDIYAAFYPEKSKIEVSITNVTLAPNESTTVPIKILNASLVDSSGLGSAKINLYYDPAIINVTNVANGANGFDTLTYNKGIGKVTMLDSGTSAVTGNDIDFANLTLKAVAGRGNVRNKWEMLLLLNERGVPINYTVEDAKKDIETLKEVLKR